MAVAPRDARGAGARAGGGAVAVYGPWGCGRCRACRLSAEKLSLAREVGADEGVEGGEGAAARIRELTEGRGAELVLDDVGADETIALASEITRFEAHLTVVGLAGGKLQFAFGALPFESQLTMPYWGTAVELGEVLDLARSGRIHAHVERFPLDRVEDAYARMREGTLEGRAVICPHG